MRFRDSLVFFLCVITVESFVSKRRRATTAVQSKEDLLKRLSDFSKDVHDINQEGTSTVVQNATRANALVKDFTAAWNRITKSFRKENVEQNEKFEFNSWKNKVLAWSKTKRRQMVDRLQRSEGKKSNQTAVATKKKVGFWEKIRTAGRTLNSREKEGVLVAGSLFDLMMILLTAIDPKSNWVPNVNIALWWVIGIIVQMSEGDMSFVDAAYMMMQIDTTIGFGTNCPITNGHKLWTALHIFLGGMFVQPMMSGYLEALFTRFDETMFPFDHGTPAGMFFVDVLFAGLCITGATTLHALVDGTGSTADWIDGLYMTIAAFQSTGYGDVAPMSPVTRGLSVIWATIGSRFWGSHVADLAGKYFDSEHLRRFGTEVEDWYSATVGDQEPSYDDTEADLSSYDDEEIE